MKKIHFSESVRESLTKNLLHNCAYLAHEAGSPVGVLVTAPAVLRDNPCNKTVNTGGGLLARI